MDPADSIFESVELESGFRLTMSADLKLIERADEQLAEFLSSCDVSVDSFAVRIVLYETVMNAVIHGCGKDPTKTVVLEVRKDEEGLVLAVQDEGQGFVMKACPAPEDVLADGGRGIALMNIYSDRVVFNEKGNRVECWKQWAPQEAVS